MNTTTIGSGKKSICGSERGRQVALAALIAGAGAMSAPGATLYWDANGATTGTGGTGNWNTTDSTWRNGSATGTLQAWANNNLVNLGGTAGTLTLTENIVAGTGTGDIIGLGASGYVINNVEGSTTTGKTLTLDGTGGSGNYRIGVNAAARDLTINAPVVLTGYTIAIRAQGATTVTFNGNISGDRGLNTQLSGVAGDWKLVLNGNNSFTGVAGDTQWHGGVYHSYGTLVVGSDTALGTGNLYWANKILQAGNGNRTVANTLRFPNDPNVEFTGANSLTFTTDVPYYATVTSARFTVTDPAATLTFGSLKESSAASAGPFEKLGAGTLAMTGQFGCGGAITVTAGTLLLNGPTGDMTALGPPATYQGQQNYTVASAGTLGGAGTINLASAKSVTVNGSLAPGNAGVGTLTVNGAVTLATGADYAWQYLNGAADLVDVNGTLSLPSAATVTVSGSGSLPATLTLFTADALTGATDLSGWTVNGLVDGKAQIQGTSVVLKTAPAGTVISIR